MKYLVLPFILLLGIVEFIVRITCVSLFSICTFFVGLVMLEDNGGLTKALTPVSFKIAEKIVG